MACILWHMNIWDLWSAESWSVQGRVSRMHVHDLPYPWNWQIEGRRQLHPAHLSGMCIIG